MAPRREWPIQAMRKVGGSQLALLVRTCSRPQRPPRGVMLQRDERARVPMHEWISNRPLPCAQVPMHEWIPNRPLPCAQVLMQLASEAPRGVLADEIWCGSVSAEAQWRRRRRFGVSLAASSVTGYLLGIGDRHSENMLLDLVGGCVGRKGIFHSLNREAGSRPRSRLGSQACCSHLGAKYSHINTGGLVYLPGRSSRTRPSWSTLTTTCASTRAPSSAYPRSSLSGKIVSNL